MFSHEYFMYEALKQAILAFDADEIPIGAVVVSENRIIARGYNQTQLLNDVTAHAEMLSITASANFLGAKYLTNCRMYVTVEPCVMCAGALYWSQLDAIIIGTSDSKRGYSQFGNQLLHPKTSVTTGILEAECRRLMQEFFKSKRI
jgi:tRNA(adenine34) deaminase